MEILPSYFVGTYILCLLYSYKHIIIPNFDYINTKKKFQYLFLLLKLKYDLPIAHNHVAIGMLLILLRPPSGHHIIIFAEPVAYPGGREKEAFSFPNHLRFPICLTPCLANFVVNFCNFCTFAPLPHDIGQPLCCT